MKEGTAEGVGSYSLIMTLMLWYFVLKLHLAPQYFDWIMMTWMNPLHDYQIWCYPHIPVVEIHALSAPVIRNDVQPMKKTSQIIREQESIYNKTSLAIAYLLG